MLIRLFWMIIYGLAFFFIYRLIVRTMQYLTRDSRPVGSQKPESPQQPSSKEEPATPRDIRDAQFRDLPDNTQKPT